MKKAKGVKKHVTDRQITFEDFERCLFNNEQLYKSFSNIESKNHNLNTVRQNKLVLNNFDDKRLLMSESECMSECYCVTRR